MEKNNRIGWKIPLKEVRERLVLWTAKIVIYPVKKGIRKQF